MADSSSLLDPVPHSTLSPTHLLHGWRPSQLELGAPTRARRKTVGCHVHTTLPSSTSSSMFLSLPLQHPSSRLSMVNTAVGGEEGAQRWRVLIGCVVEEPSLLRH